jgi:hypothetical protein
MLQIISGVYKMKLDKYLNEGIYHISTVSYSKDARKLIDALVDSIEHGKDMNKTLQLLDRTLDRIHDDAYESGFNNGHESGQDEIDKSAGYS